MRRLREALERLMAEPHGCAFCDYGTPRRVFPDSPDHDEGGCAWEQAREALAAPVDVDTTARVLFDAMEPHCAEMFAEPVMRWGDISDGDKARYREAAVVLLGYLGIEAGEPADQGGDDA